MDLRLYLNTATDAPRPGEHALFEEGMRLIQAGELWYQPFILADGIEVGEGQNLHEYYRNTKGLLDHNVFLAPDHLAYWQGNTRALATDKAYFRDCNAKYRLSYELMLNVVIDRLGDALTGTSFLELGCNTGLNLFNLAVRGAGSCIGVDWTDHGPAISWLNRVLKTDVRFLRGIYDNLIHTIPGVEIEPADVVINTAFIHHQCDPIQLLCWLGDRARKAMLLWVILNDDAPDAEMSVVYDRVSGVQDLGAGKPLPLNFHNSVRLSPALLKDCLRRLGFEEIEIVVPPAHVRERTLQSMSKLQMVWARRTHERRSAFAR